MCLAPSSSLLAHRTIIVICNLNVVAITAIKFLQSGVYFILFKNYS